MSFFNEHKSDFDTVRSSEEIRRGRQVNEFCLNSGKMFRRLVESVKNGFFVTDNRGQLFYVNDAFVQILGYDKKESVIGLNMVDKLYVQEKDKAFFRERMKTVGFVRNLEVEYFRQDGSRMVLSITSNTITNERGAMIGFEGVVYDVTEKHKIEEMKANEHHKLKQILGFSEKIGSYHRMGQLAEFIIEHTAEILGAQRCSLMLLDEHCGELCIQRALKLDEKIIRQTRIRLGEPIAGIVAKTGRPILVKNVEYDKTFQRANRPEFSTRSFMIAPIKIGQEVMGVINVADKDTGESREESFEDLDLRILSSIAREVAVAIKNVRLYTELHSLATTDPLTEIFNYRHFSKSLQYEISRAQRSKSSLSLIMIDVDDFKSYNDTYGHLEGDELLRVVGHTLKENLREMDIPCRYAGDEFAVILPEANVEGAKTVAEKINVTLRAYPFKRAVTLSLGVVGYCLGKSKYEFILKADRALYQAKHEGKNQVCVYE